MEFVHTLQLTKQILLKIRFTCYCSVIYLCALNCAFYSVPSYSLVTLVKEISCLLLFCSELLNYRPIISSLIRLMSCPIHYHCKHNEPMGDLKGQYCRSQAFLLHNDNVPTEMFMPEGTDPILCLFIVIHIVSLKI